MLLMHAYAALFMLLAQSSHRDAFVAEALRRLDRWRRWIRPRPPVRRIPVEAGDVCAFCHEDLLTPPPADEEAQHRGRLAGLVLAVAGAVVAWLSSALRLLLGVAVWGAVSSAVERACRACGSHRGGHAAVESGHEVHCVHCRWGCGRAVHRKCAASWGRDLCVFCSAPMT